MEELFKPNTGPQLEILDLHIVAKEAELKALHLQRKMIETPPDMSGLNDTVTNLMSQMKGMK